MATWRKKRPTINFLERGMILCEGETEQNYFTGLIKKEEYRRKFAAINVEIYKPKNHSPKGLVSEAKQKAAKAKKEKDPYDFIWVVFDHDGHANIANAFDESLDCNPRIQIAFTVTCFEFFVLLHFKKSTKSYSNCDDVISELKKHLPDYKKATNLFSLLDPHINIGLENSKWCQNHFSEEIDSGRKIYNCDPYSNIHELIHFLFSLIGIQHLSEKFIHQLVKLPETGKGYQLVNVFLSNGKILRKHKVLNSSILVLEPNEDISTSQIDKIELEH